MLRLFVNICLLSLIAFTGWYFIAPNIICWQEGGTWQFEKRECNVGTFVVPTTPTLSLVDQKIDPPAESEDSAATATQYKDLIKLASPVPKSVVMSPLTVSGQARGTWFFEASFPILVVDINGKEIGRGIAHADGEWMTSEYVPFSASIIFKPGVEKKGKLVLHKDNPSGMPENDDSFSVPILF